MVDASVIGPGLEKVDFRLKIVLLCLLEFETYEKSDIQREGC